MGVRSRSRVGAVVRNRLGAITAAALIAITAGGSALAPLPHEVAAQGQDCQFVLGFATLRDLVGPEIVGDCLEDQRFTAAGDAEQHTTRGLLVWRRADNWTAFTDGYWTWINGPEGLARRLNTERFAWEADASDSSAAAPPEPSPAPAPSQVASVQHPPRPAGLPQAQVVRVIDGDTVDVAVDVLPGQTVRLRLIGIDTPEVVDTRVPVQCFGREASAKAHELLDGQTVWLEADESQGERDAFGRLLRYVWLPDGRLFNLVMVAEGYAHEFTFNIPYRYQALFKQAQALAREQGAGLWSPETCAGDTARPAGSPAATATVPTATATPLPAVTPSPAPTAASTPRPQSTATPAPAARCDPAYPDVCIPPPPPDLDCADIPYRNFRVLPPDPHRFDGDRDGIGCERS